MGEGRWTVKINKKSPMRWWDGWGIRPRYSSISMLHHWSSIGAIAHPAFLTEDHFRKLTSRYLCHFTRIPTLTKCSGKTFVTCLQTLPRKIQRPSHPSLALACCLSSYMEVPARCWFYNARMQGTELPMSGVDCWNKLSSANMEGRRSESEVNLGASVTWWARRQTDETKDVCEF